MSSGHHTRKIIKVGTSYAVVIPPHILDLMHAELGDLLIFDTSAAPFLILSKVAIPPYVTKPEQFGVGPSNPI